MIILLTDEGGGGSTRNNQQENTHYLGSDYGRYVIVPYYYQNGFLTKITYINRRLSIGVEVEVNRFTLSSVPD